MQSPSANEQGNGGEHEETIVLPGTAEGENAEASSRTEANPMATV
jgi:hypothetical protein